MLTSAPDFTQFDIPEYLYDGIGGNDVNYLLNKNILFGDTVKTLQRQENFSFDDMYVWEKNYTFSEKEVLYGKQAYVKSRLKTVKSRWKRPRFYKRAVQIWSKISYPYSAKSGYHLLSVCAALQHPVLGYGAPQGGNRRAALHAGGYGGAAFGLPQCKAVLLSEYRRDRNRFKQL